MKTVICEENELNRRAAEHIERLLREKPNAVLALTAGRSTRGLYGELSRRCSAGALSFKQARVFAVTEYVGASYDNSCRAVLERELLNNTDVEKANVFFPDPVDCESYDRLLSDSGGIDLAVLGIGHNGHIGYNEPATLFDTHTHVQKLTDKTKRQLIASGRAPESIPEQAVTMGIKTLVDARDIILLALGSDKADTVFLMVYGKTITYIPASFLQIPTEVTVYLDEAAAEKL